VLFFGARTINLSYPNSATPYLAWLSVILTDPTTDFTVRVFPVLIPDTFEKKSYLLLVPLLIKFFDVRLFLYFQKFLALLGLYFFK
jgi:hypothetical protein